jgi:hypothetical protein
MKVRVGVGGMALAILLGWACAGQMRASAQSTPVPVRLEVKSPRGAALGDASIGIATGPNEPFSFYRSNARGEVTVPLAPGKHDLRLFARGFPMTYERLEVGGPGMVEILLGRGTEASPATAVVQARTEAPSRRTASGAAAGYGRAAGPAGKPLAGGGDALQAYTSCSFPDGLEIQAVKPLAAGPLLVATPAGTRTIDTAAGVQVMFSYPMTDYFANAKVESLPADLYAQSKEILLGNLQLMESQRNGPVRAEALPAGLHGFEVHGNNRAALDGDVLGMYLLFDDATHVVATVSFLNQHTWQRKFQTMAEYERLRDSFLRSYTGCVRQNQAIER